LDIYCKVCGEPLDVAELHDIEGMTFGEARNAFYAEGCVGVGFTHSNTKASHGPEIEALQELLGDDIDGVAAMMEDFDLGY